MKDRLKNISRKQWIKAAVWGVLYVLFLVWHGNWWWLLLLPLIVDAFTTKFIPWTWWKRYKPAGKDEPENPKANKILYTICSWIDAIVFALVAVYFINLYLFQNYQIPSSSLEKSLRVGDFLFVSKASYGARVPNTPFSFPLVQHTFPQVLGGGKSYIDKPQWKYRRLKGWEVAVSQKRRAIILETQSCNTNAIGFYLHQGFELIGFDTCCYTNNDISILAPA